MDLHHTTAILLWKLKRGKIMEKYYVWSCPSGWLAAATSETLGNGEEPWRFYGYSYVGCCMAASAAEARAQFQQPA